MQARQGLSACRMECHNTASMQESHGRSSIVCMPWGTLGSQKLNGKGLLGSITLSDRIFKKKLEFWKYLKNENF